MFDRKTFIRWAYRCNYRNNVMTLEELLVQAAQELHGLDTSASLRFASTHKVKAWNALVDAMERDRNRGVLELFGLDDITRVRLTIQSMQLVSCTRRQIHDRTRLRQRAAVLRAIDDLDDRQYEAFCCSILEYVGAVTTSLTPPGNEGGVDAFALARQPTIGHLIFHETKPIRLVLQMKKYASAVKVDKIRDFSNVLQHVRNRNPATERHTPYWFRNARGVVGGMLIAHSGFQSGVVSQAADEGIVLLDSVDLAEFFSQCKRLSAYLTKERASSVVDRLVDQTLRRFTASA